VLGGAATVSSPEVVFGGVTLVAVGLAAWAWRMPGVAPEEGPGMQALRTALRRPAVLAGVWLFTLPALFAGAIEVLAPLRLDTLGASGAAIGAIFLVTAAVEAVLSPMAGRYSDRRGRLAPIRAGLVGALLMGVLLPLPETPLLVGAGVLLAIAALGIFWAPVMAMLSESSEDVGLGQGLAFSIGSLAWAAGHLVGSAAGGALADASSDAVAYAGLAALCAVTLAGVIVLGREAPARAPAAR
jgi:predicted MFS family arabinose efflux permease